MDLHIYDMKLAPEDAVIVTGHIEKDEVESFAGYLKVLQSIFPNPVIYIPDDSSIDAIGTDGAVALLKDAMSIGALQRLRLIVYSALSENGKDNPATPEEDKPDEV